MDKFDWIKWLKWILKEQPTGPTGNLSYTAHIENLAEAILLVEVKNETEELDEWLRENNRRIRQVFISAKGRKR